MKLFQQEKVCFSYFGTLLLTTAKVQLTLQ